MDNTINDGLVDDFIEEVCKQLDQTIKGPYGQENINADRMLQLVQIKQQAKIILLLQDIVDNGIKLK
jgi:hypothetical protein